MLVPTTGFLAGFAGVAAALWLLAAIFPRSTITLLGVVSSVLVAAALTWRAVALNRAGLALPEDMVSPAIDGWAAILPTIAWVVAAVQVLTLGAGYAPWGDVLAALLILALIVWPHSAPFAALTHGARVYGADGRAVLLLALALAGSMLAARGGLALLPHIRGHALSRHAGRVEWGLLTAGALAASLAAALLAWHVAGARGGWCPAVSWLAALAAIHLLAVLSALARRGSSTVPAWVGLVGCGLLLAYIALASAGRIPGA